MAKNWVVLPILPLLLLFTQGSTQIHPTDLAALRQIKNSLTAAQFFSTWDFSSPDPCSSFAGLTCSGSRVTILTLGTGLSDSPGLAGSLSPAISRLSALTQLILFAGIVTGPIPPDLASLRRLRVISLTNNRLTGPIPPDLLRLPDLHTLDLSRNRLSGAVPAPAPRLKILVLAGNRLSGEFPGDLPPELIHLDLSGNLLFGELPATLPPALRYLSAASNRLWGPLRGSLDPLSDLAYVDLSMNQFSGPVPGSLLRPGVATLLLQRNNLSGGIPASAPWPAVEGSTVDLSHNFLSGEVGAALAGVETLFLNNNRLSGGVATEYVESVVVGTMKTLYLQHNYLTGFPLEVGSALPDAAAVCVSYNCMAAPPLGLAACPVSAGDQLSRPAYQCAGFHNSLD
ncbi:LRR receptor-like serine/threonine-protein kinase FLS2 [Salvia hispanica]|uniref:LRR receptor-like serine/threonine-protein kinase FLS2 n=1 Tax=Salvia hispanica TaxID=49212 RepID=UPI002009008C|nr:LRR receptor-like serine/threonine-protein kinase FLS2 [Salvia hispanica]